MPLSEILAAVRWWAALSALGLLALPGLFVLLRRLPDRGYAFARMAGLLATSYVFWLAGSLGFSGANAGGIVLALLVLGGLSFWLYRSRAADDSLSRWLSEHKATVIATEVIFAAVFALWVWVRAQNPSITATEKPMEFAFLNAVGRSSSFPPLDPWLSGYGISYYYFGYVMTSLLARLAAVQEAIAFNLSVAWLVAGAAIGAYGLTYNLIASRARARSALILGLVAAAAVPIAGNMQIGLEIAHGNNVGSAAFWDWLDIRDINEPPQESAIPRYRTSNWWWWRTSRVIHEYHLSGRSEEGLEPIVEVPSFSFVLGDLHPHVLALPFAFLSLGVALAWYLNSRARDDLEPEQWEAAGLVDRLRRLIAHAGFPLWLFTALVLGGLSFLNTWDVLIHLFVVLGAFYLARWYTQGHTSGLLGQTLLLALLLVVPAVLIYLPFYLGLRSQTAPPFLLPMLMQPTRLAHYAVIFGLPLLAISALLVALAIRARFRYWARGLALALGLLVALLVVMVLLMWIMASTPAASQTYVNLASDLGIALPAQSGRAIDPLWGGAAVIRLLPAVLGARLFSPYLVLYLLGLLTLTVMALLNGRDGAQERPDKPDSLPVAESLPFALLLILTGLLLSLGPEFVYLRDNFGARLNTMFKFYYQAWAMFGVAAVFSLDYLWSAWREGARRAIPALVTAGYAVALFIALLFPFYAVQSRAIEYRGPAETADGQRLERQPSTLNGLAYLQRFNPSEYEAVMWLLEQAQGNGLATPVVLEAVGGQYSGYGRVSANTGLPTVLGWPGHEWQWRGGDHPEPGRRQPMVEQIYTARDLELVDFMLDELDIAYIFVGDLEASTYGVDGLQKFADHLDVAYANDRVTIYRWQSDAGT